MKYYIKQIGEKDCGVTCVKMLLAIVYKNTDYLYYPHVNVETSSSLRDLINLAKKEGVIIKASRIIDKKALFKKTVSCPFLIVINKKDNLHMVLIKKITKSRVKVYDPSSGIYWISKNNLFKIWNGEILEVSNILTSNFKLKKIRVYPKYFFWITILFQFLSLLSLITATFFIDKKFSFMISFLLFLSYIIFELLYQKIIILSLKYFDNQIFLEECFFKRQDFNKYYLPMSKFKFSLVSTPVKFISSFFMLVFGCIILGINNYWSLLILAITFAFQYIFKKIDNKFYKTKKNNLENIENKLLSNSNINGDEFKNEVKALNSQSYECISYNNFKRYFLIFLTICLSLIYIGFTGFISINYMFFHFFIFVFLQEQFEKIIEIDNDIENIKYYKCLYFYHFN